MRYIVLLLILFILTDCNHKKKYIADTVFEWTNKKIIFPPNVQTKIMGRDTICNDLLAKPIKILVFIDSSGCAACKLNLYDWYQKIKSLSEIQELGFLFYIHTNNYKKFTNAVKVEDFRYPLFYDTHNSLATLNHLPKDQHFNTFLLNKENRVELIGNPLGKESFWKLYIQQIDSLIASLKMIQKNNAFHQ